MDKTASDAGQAHGTWLIKAFFWCDVCSVTTLHYSDGPADEYDGAGWVWRWFCRDCQGMELRLLGPLRFDADPPVGPRARDGSPWSAGLPEALQCATLESACEWLTGFLADRVLPAWYVIGQGRRFGYHERLLREVKASLNIRSDRWLDRWWWVPPWIPWQFVSQAREWRDTRRVQPSLRKGPGIPVDEDGLPW